MQLYKYLKNGLITVLKSEFEPIHEKLNGLEKNIIETRKEACKNFLVRCFEEIENGKELDDVILERVYETFAVYDGLGGNGYLHSRYEKLKKEGKL